jgi:succinate dehydrogenase hydrophobic anchor subunit
VLPADIPKILTKHGLVLTGLSAITIHGWFGMRSVRLG